MRNRLRLLQIALVLLLLFEGSVGVAAPAQQEPSYRDLAANLLAGMTPAERVGQLFLVTFEGVEGGPRTPIAELITEYHVGGVILRTDNDNFLAHDQTVPFTQDLARQLQNHRYASAQQEAADPVTEEIYQPAYVPLLIGMMQEGNGYPYDQIQSPGFSQLPSQMAVGAAWQPDLAREVGRVLGRELSYLGINLLLGPSLDVLETPHSEVSAGMGVRTFGGDPYWVGEMGRAFITGVHLGSDDEIAVIAKHFPGYGSSDRLPEEEVATVLKSIEQLKLIEIPPFAAVTGNAPNTGATADGLLTSHIRYQGFQEGNSRRTYRPVSLDQTVLSELMNLPALQSWRQNGGVLVSDDLGSRAVRRFYEFSGQTYIGRYVARDAFYAGNDLLYLGNISSQEVPDYHTAIIRTIEFFNQRYREDPIFAQRVDESALRILELKYRLYKGTFSLTNTLPPSSVPSLVGSSNISLEVLRQAATIVWPSQTELSNSMPEPPGRNDRIVFITDTRYARQCTRCPMRAMISQQALEEAVIRLYSPGAGGQVLPRNLVSYTFDHLQEMLEVGSNVVQIESDLRNARWIVFVALNETPEIPSSRALQRFLDQRIDLLQNKQVIVFSLDAPYFLDSTDISKLTAYYALYSKTPRSIEIAARLLFQDIRAVGSLPISAPNAGYDLKLALEPNPSQTIELFIEGQNEGEPASTSTPTPGIITGYRAGDLVQVATGMITDLKGHQVPDNTYVRFLVSRGEGGTAQSYTIETTTVKGVARATIRIEGQGQMQVRAESERARSSTVLVFDLPPAENGVQETETPVPSPTQTATATPSPTNTATPTQVPPPPVEEPPTRGIRFSDWLLAMTLTIAIGLASYWLSISVGQVRWGVRSGFLTLIGGLLAYTYVAMELPGAASLIETGGTWGITLAALVGAVIGFGTGWSWKLSNGRK
jgi:beta-N-acetylhexosaminidase